ncbi:DUF58 domain-containing protein [Sphingomonas sp. KR1UV-12]|uniref:DUF58 domain-containing protein n=1 Tax=Sphingomonas aurea TaxID=3063994 RepID=A0ABT9EIF2_9SPHN|nr:DUF58 domain-containing protein [Sphingomonas sp. KR1UV-12]MDP1026744.1 DUF58 domain-containing protein [Sphingomonas sp. KR1UV-12]
MVELIPADVRHRLRDLTLATRRAIGDRGLGAHRSASRGAGLEFAQYRPYERGDEPRQIDWKLYGRSDRFFVREAERESPVAAWVLLDTSGSMGQADAARPDRSRLDAGRALAACIVELALMQGDRFALVTLGEAMRVVPPHGGARARDRLRLELAGLSAGGVLPDERALAPVWGRIGQRDLVVVVSDFFDAGTLDLAVRLSAAGREVLAIQILTVEERNFPFDGGYRFRDPETGEELLGDGAALRAEFVARFGAAQVALHAGLDAAGIRRGELVLDQPLDTPLRTLFG